MALKCSANHFLKFLRITQASLEVAGDWKGCGLGNLKEEEKQTGLDLGGKHRLCPLVACSRGIGVGLRQWQLAVPLLLTPALLL